MDYRLDLYNAITRYQEQMTEEDALFIICNNSRQGDLFFGIDGDLQILGAIVMSGSNYVNIETKKQKKAHRDAQRGILNLAYWIIKSDEKLLAEFKKGLETI